MSTQTGASGSLPADGTAFADLIAGSPAAIVLADETGHILEFNSAAEAIFGWARSEVLGLSIGDLMVPPNLRDAHEVGMARMRDGGTPRVLGRKMEMPALRSNGEEFPCEVALSSLTIGGRRVVAAIMRDNSELHSALEKQQQSTAFLKSIFDDQTEVIFRFDADFRLNYANDAALRFYGIGPDDFRGRHLFEDVAPEVAERLRTEIAALTPEDPTTRAIDPKRLPNGEIRWIDWTNRALFDGDGRRVGYLSVGRDVTDRRRSELALERERQENALYRRMVEALPDFLYAKDLDGRYLTANEAVARARGRARSADLIGRREHEVSGADFAERLAAEERAFLDSGQETAIDTHAAWHPGFEGRWHTTQRVLFRDREGNVIGFIVHVRDVTVEVTARTALAESEARFATFMRNAPVGMYLKDAEGRYLLANPEMANVFGRPVDEVLGRSAAEVFAPDLVAVIDAADDLVRRTRQPSAIEEYLPGADRYAWTLVVRFPLEAAEGADVLVGGFDIDITPIKRAEEEVGRAREALHQGEKLNALGAFAAGVAHELNNPLTILAGQAEMLAEEARGGPLAARAATIERVTERCGRIARSFLSVSRRRPPQIAAVDLGEIVDTALEIARFTLRNAGIRVDRRVGAGLPRVAGDPDQLHQVLLNLLLNAQQAMVATDPPRSLAIVASLAPDERHVHLDVRDSGPGIAPADHERIFEPFYTTREAGGGTGLGLSISRTTIEGLGGRIELAESTFGATFRITLAVAGQHRRGP